MKKALYSTTILATAGLFAVSAGDAFGQAAAPAAERLKINVGGYMQQFIAYADQDSDFERATGTHYKGVDQSSDSEIHFTGSLKLDNGVTLRVVVELEADQTSQAAEGDRIDESFLQISHPTFGMLQLGADDAITQVLNVAAPWVGMTNPHDGDFTQYLIAPTTVGGAAAAAAGTLARTSTSGAANANDDNRIVYRSPKIMGFTLGGGFAPDANNSNTQPTVGSQDVWDVGLQYSEKFGAVGFRASASYFVDEQTTKTASTESWTLGADVTFADFTFGGAYAEDTASHDALFTGATVRPDDKRFNVGLKYAPGPYEVGVYYGRQWAPRTSADPDDDTHQRFLLGAKYTLGPGVSVAGSLIRATFQNEANTAAQENDAWALIGGIEVAF